MTVVSIQDLDSALQEVKSFVVTIGRLKASLVGARGVHLLIIAIYMSSIKDPRSKATVASDVWGEEEATRPSSLTDYKKKSMFTSKENTGEAEDGGKAASLKEEANDIAPAQRGNDSQPHAASGASITSQPERRAARTTRSRAQSMNCNDQLNGGKRFQEQVSTPL